MAMNEYLSADDSQTPEEARISALYKEAANETPPADLDRKIAAAAHAGSQTTSGGRLLSWLNTFRIPLATAAVLVVSASLVMTMREEHEDRLVNSPSVAIRMPAEPAPAPEISAGEPAAQGDRKSENAAEAKTRDRAEESPMRPPAIARQSEGELRKENSETAYGRYLKSSPPKLADRGKAADLEPRSSAPLPDEQAQVPVPAPMVAPAPEPGFAARREAAAAATRDEAAAPPPPSYPSVPLEKRAPAAAAAPQVPAAPPADSAAAAPPPQPVLNEPVLRSLPERSAPGALGALRRTQPRLSRPAQSSPPEAVESAPRVGAPDAPRERTPEERRVLLGRLQALNLPPPDISAHLAALESRPPSAWLDRVRLLQREGLLLEADRLLAEFKRRFPEERVPSDVQ